MSSACGHQPRGEGEPRGRGGSLSLLGSCSSSPLTPPQFALYKKMTQAAILIQSKFRSYYEQKRFQQSRRAALLIQKYYRSYRKCGKRRQARRTAVIVQQKLRCARCPLQGAQAGQGPSTRGLALAQLALPGPSLLGV